MLTISQLCERWKVSDKTVRRYMRQGLRARRLGWRTVRFEVGDVEQFEQRRKMK